MSRDEWRLITFSHSENIIVLKHFNSLRLNCVVHWSIDNHPLNWCISRVVLKSPFLFLDLEKAERRSIWFHLSYFYKMKILVNTNLAWIFETTIFCYIYQLFPACWPGGSLDLRTTIRSAQNLPSKIGPLQCSEFPWKIVPLHCTFSKFLARKGENFCNFPRKRGIFARILCHFY